MRLRSVSLLALCGMVLSPSALALQDAAEFDATQNSAPRWLAYFAEAPARPAVTAVALDAFDPGFGIDAPEPSGFTVRHASLAEIPLKHERAPLPPSLASRFAIALPNAERGFDTITVRGAYAEPSPEVAPSGATLAEFTAVSTTDGATPSAPVVTASLTPFEQMPTFQRASLPAEPVETGSIAPVAPASEAPVLALAIPGDDIGRARQCLAEAIYFEARSENEKGQYAVAQVVMNRTRTGFYPATVCGVVYENKNRRNKCQFSFACDGKPDRVRDQRSWTVAKRIADDVLINGAYLPDIGTSTHYHATYVHPRWVRDMTDRHRVGTHVFYRVKSWSDEGV